MTKIKDKLQDIMNRFSGPVKDRWKHLSIDDKREIARYLADNRDIIEDFLGPINEKDNIYKLLRNIETYSVYEHYLSRQPQPQQNLLNKYTVFRYINELKNLEEIIKNIEKGYLSTLPQYPNIARPSNNHIEIVLGIRGKPKETLVEILKEAIGNIVVRGYPAFYYDPSKYNNADLPLIYYVQLDNNSFFQRFFIHKINLPAETTGYLLHKLSNIIQPKRKSLILPSGNQYYVIKDYLDRDLVAIDQNPNTNPYILQSLRFFHVFQKFAKNNEFF